MRLNPLTVERQSYSGKPSVDAYGRSQWPSCVLWDEDIPGFGLRIHPPAANGLSRKEFVFSYRVGMRSRVMSIGVYGKDCTLRQARHAATDALTCSRRGLDPMEARQEAHGIGTVEDLARRFLFQRASANARKTVAGQT
jgi:hypothetical protein